MKKKITIKDVAKASGVSITTVSMILNHQEERFSKETVEKVLAAKKELDYEPNYYAQKMITKHSYTIGVLVSDLSNPFFNQLVQGLQKELILKGYLMVLCDTTLDQKRETDYLEELTRREVDGVIIASAVGEAEKIKAYLKSKDTPYVFLDQQQDEDNSLGTDDFIGGSLAADHLLAYGHRHIALVYPKEAPLNIEARRKGFISRLQKNQITPVFIEGGLSKETGYQSVKELLTYPEITAIFTVNDAVALGLYRGLYEAGKRIPEDYSLVGYDDISMASYLTPPLTTVHQPIEELGSKTTQLLLESLEKGLKIKKESLPVSFVLRKSTKKLK